MNEPLVSVIIPCFNYARFLGDALDSLVCQTCPDWEAIVVDDGSTDETASVVRRWMDRDPRIVGVRQPRRGLAAARNRGLDTARGRYVQFLDADDSILPAKFAVQIEMLREAARPALCYSDYRRLVRRPDGTGGLESGQPVGFDAARAAQDVALRWETEVSVPIHCHLFDARLLRESGARFDERLANHEDWLFLLQALKPRPPVLRTDDVLAIYRMHGGSMTRDLVRMRAGFLDAIRFARETFAGDAEMLQLLDEKERITRRQYEHVSPRARVVRAVRRPVGRVLPSRLKRFLRSGLRSPS